MTYYDPTWDPNNSIVSKAMDYTLTNNLTHIINGEREKIQVPSYLGLKNTQGTQTTTDNTSIFNTTSPLSNNLSGSIFENQTNVPPGLAKKGGVPPGLAKKGGMPPGLAKKEDKINDRDDDDDIDELDDRDDDDDMDDLDDIDDKEDKVKHHKKDKVKHHKHDKDD
jgi:hypothetical protein